MCGVVGCGGVGFRVVVCGGVIFGAVGCVVAPPPKSTIKFVSKPRSMQPPPPTALKPPSGSIPPPPPGT